MNRMLRWSMVWAVVLLSTTGCQHRLFRLRGARCKPGLLNSLHLPRLHGGAPETGGCSTGTCESPMMGGPVMGGQVMSGPGPMMSSEPMVTNDVIVGEYPGGPIEGGIPMQTTNRPIVSGPVVEGPSAGMGSIPGPESAPLPGN